VIGIRLTGREVIHRLGQPAWVASQALRYIQEATARVSPSHFASLFRKVSPLTMCSYARLLSLHRAVTYIEKNKIPGDIVECGVAHGGSAAIMALTLGHHARRLWLFDTFEGLPAPSEKDPDLRIASAYTRAFDASLDEVQSSFRQLGIEQNIVMVPGLFKDTLPSCEVKSIALLHVDGDWYESVMTTLQNLYDRVAAGGVIQFDDYGHWAGARRAVDEFMNERHITQPLRRIDFSGRQLIKT
jgi:AraC-like DNA-binding protein